MVALVFSKRSLSNSQNRLVLVIHYQSVWRVHWGILGPLWELWGPQWAILRNLVVHLGRHWWCISEPQWALLGPQYGKHGIHCNGSHAMQCIEDLTTVIISVPNPKDLALSLSSEIKKGSVHTQHPRYVVLILKCLITTHAIFVRKMSPKSNH